MGRESLSRALGAFRHPAASPLVALTALGLAIRLAGIGQDLWIDEISTLDEIRAATVGDLLRSYDNANQHTLNSVLVWLSIRTFGETEWAIRLSAVLCGAATIPVFYWVARLARFAAPWALFGTALLALSSHHVWFSANARGYAGYLLFSLLGIGGLVRVIETGATRWIVLFIVASGLNFLALLMSAFVFGAEVLAVAGFAIAHRRRAQRHRLATERAVLTALVGAAVLALLIYLPLVRQMFLELGRTAPTQTTAFRMFSVEFVTAILQGLAPGIPPILLGLAIVPGALGLWGLARLTQQAPLIVATCLGGHLLFGAAILLLNWPIYPRLFILLLPLGLLILLGVLDGLDRLVAARAPQRRVGVTGGAALLLLVGFLVLLRPVLVLQKQPYRAALAAAFELAEPTDEVLVVGVADRGIGFYAQREDRWSERLRYARTLEEFAGVLAESRAPRILLISSFEAAMAVDEPEVWARMTAGWNRAVRLAGTVRGGDLNIWTPVEDSRRAPGGAPRQ